MATKNDGGTVAGGESSDVVTLTNDELQRMIAEAVASATSDAEANTTPAIEEGPHLKGDVADVKRDQLKAAKVRANSKELTDDMRKLLEG